MPYIFDAILQETTEEDALDYARGLDWSSVEGRSTDMPWYWRYIDTVNGIGVYYDYGADYYFYIDESEG